MSRISVIRLKLSWLREMTVVPEKLPDNAVEGDPVDRGVSFPSDIADGNDLQILHCQSAPGVTSKYRNRCHYLDKNHQTPAYVRPAVFLFIFSRQVLHCIHFIYIFFRELDKKHTSTKVKLKC